MSEEPKYENKPYKGHLSYQLEDGAFFFGRARQADQLAAKILASPLTLVHARSGAGKTSLLNASVIPGLEERGWTVALARPHFNASESLRNAALSQILPPPAVEADALDAAKSMLFPDRPDLALQEMLDRFDLIEPRDAKRRALLQPLPGEPAMSGGAIEAVRPLFFRLLRATLEIKQYGEHIEALLEPDGTAARQGKMGRTVSVRALAELLRQPRLAEGRSQLAAGLLRDGPNLKSFVEQLLQRYGKRRSGFGLVLIVDQFEEMFTRFTADPNASGPSNASQPTWKLRFEFFDELQELYEATASLPVHVVLSMRDEYIAQLDPLRRFIRDLDAASYHLTFLEKEEAGAAIREPARIFGYDYDDKVYADIFGALLQEDRFIEPSQLQIVCEKLWEIAGKLLARTERPLSADPALIGESVLPEGGSKQILQNFFTEYLQELDAANPDGESRMEALEILDALVVAETGTRNVVERKVLERAPFHDPERRAAVLESLAEKRIVRLEPRLGGEFAEITHEFLIPSIREHINTELNGNSDYADLRWALRALIRYKDVDIREGTGNLLPKSLFAILHRERHRLFLGTSAWEKFVPELILRSALALGAAREEVAYWLNDLREREVDLSPEEILSEARIHDPSRRSMSLCELAAIVQQAPTCLNAGQRAFVLRNLLARADDGGRESIIYWTRQMEEPCT